jgi:hypothetical protein
MAFHIILFKETEFYLHIVWIAFSHPFKNRLSSEDDGVKATRPTLHR